MRITKISAEPTIETNNAQSFKAIKLKNSTIRNAERLTKDVFESRKNLPQQEAKPNKYFGGYDPYTSGTPQINDGDGWKMAAIVGAGLAALALM